MKKTTLFFSAVLFLMITSCTTLETVTPLYNSSIGDKCDINVKIFQAFNSHEALAKGFGSNDIVVKLITTEDTFYDGKILSGRYVMVDTYTYTHKNDGKKDSEEYIKTVPVFIKVSEYNRYKPLQEKEPEGQKL